MSISFVSGIGSIINKAVIDNEIILQTKSLFHWTGGNNSEDSGGLGWKNINKWANDSIVEEIIDCSNYIRETADTLIFIGIGGSSFPAMSVIQGLTATPSRNPEILCFGNSVSARSLYNSLESIKDKSICVFVTAKNFETVEPGVHFRIIRKLLEDKYSSKAKDRIFVCGSKGNNQLIDYANIMGFKSFLFPEDSCVRYAGLSASGLLPMAVAGVDIKLLLEGANNIACKFTNCSLLENDAIRYAVARRLLFNAGYKVEIQTIFEKCLTYMGKLWQELFAENEGKNKRGVLPIPCTFSEDLHAIGQFIQDGSPIFFETFLDFRDLSLSYRIKEDAFDGFSYLDNKEYNTLSNAVYLSALRAHSEGGVPCLEIKCDQYDAYGFGELIYFFMYSSFISAKLFSVNPFNQPGVENYKRHMWNILGKVCKE